MNSGWYPPRASDARTGVHAADPSGVDVVLVPPQLRVPVHDDRVTLWRKSVLRRGRSAGQNLGISTSAYLVRVAADARHARHAEVEGLHRPETGLLDERHDEAAQAAVDVQTNVILLSERAECGDVVLVAVGEVDGRADELVDEMSYAQCRMTTTNAP